MRVLHVQPLIPADLAESLDSHREALRVSLGEPYRTMLGHFRHEIGHYYQDILVGDLLGAISRHEVEPLIGSGLGQGIAWFRQETTVADVMQRFVDEARASIERVEAVRAASLTTQAP